MSFVLLIGWITRKTFSYCTDISTNFHSAVRSTNTTVHLGISNHFLPYMKDNDNGVVVCFFSENHFLLWLSQHLSAKMYILSGTLLHLVVRWSICLMITWHFDIYLTLKAESDSDRQVTKRMKKTYNIFFLVMSFLYWAQTEGNILF